MAAQTRQQEALRFGQSRGWGQGAQGKDTVHDSAPVFIDRHQTFGVEFAERDMQRPLVRPDLAQTVQRKIDAFPDADSGDTSEEQRVGRQVIGAAQFVAEQLVVLWRERSGQILGQRREVLAADEVRLDRVA